MAKILTFLPQQEKGKEQEGAVKRSYEEAVLGDATNVMRNQCGGVKKKSCVMRVGCDKKENENVKEMEQKKGKDVHVVTVGRVVQPVEQKLSVTLTKKAQEALHLSACAKGKEKVKAIEEEDLKVSRKLLNDDICATVRDSTSAKLHKQTNDVLKSKLNRQSKTFVSKQKERTSSQSKSPVRCQRQTKSEEVSIECNVFPKPSKRMVRFASSNDVNQDKSALQEPYICAFPKHPLKQPEGTYRTLTQSFSSLHKHLPKAEKPNMQVRDKTRKVNHHLVAQEKFYQRVLTAAKKFAQTKVIGSSWERKELQFKNQLNQLLELQRLESYNNGNELHFQYSNIWTEAKMLAYPSRRFRPIDINNNQY